jgi:hypothetical protein
MAFPARYRCRLGIDGQLSLLEKRGGGDRVGPMNKVLQSRKGIVNLTPEEAKLAPQTI